MVAVAGRSQFISRSVPKVKTVNYTAAYLAPMLIIVLVTMLTLIVTHSGFDYYYPARFFAAAGALWFFRKAYVGLSWRCSWEAVAVGVGVFVLWMAPNPPPTPPPTRPLAPRFAAWARAGRFSGCSSASWALL